MVNRRADLELVVMPAHISKKQIRESVPRPLARNSTAGTKSGSRNDSILQNRGYSMRDMNVNSNASNFDSLFVEPSTRRALPQEFVRSNSKIRIGVDPSWIEHQERNLPEELKSPQHTNFYQLCSKPFSIDKG